MNRKIRLSLFLILLTLGCREENLKTTALPWSIEGTEITSFFPSSHTRATKESIPVGSTLTLYSQGGLQTEALTLSYNGIRWEGDNLPKWNPTQPTTTLTAFCPPLYRNQSDFYTEGQLCDQLIAQEECTYQKNIQLTFRHLFAQVRFTVSSRLNQRLSQIEFIPSLSVSNITPETGEIAYQPTDTPLCVEKNDEKEYTFLLPPTTLSIQIRIHTNDGTVYESTLENYPFQSGHTYTCPLKIKGETLGISTVEDFIAFTHLINGEEYGDRSLEEFGEKTGETMTYYLNEDLTFTPEEANRVQMIGEYGTATSSKKRLFNDTFDGQGHSLNNLRFEQSFTAPYYVGLFSGLSATGVVKNLTLNQAIYNKNSDTKKAAFLVGINQGEINHCILRDCTIENIRSDSQFGCLNAWNEGTIINCHVDNVNLKNKILQGNIITRYNKGGKIINCAITRCNFNKSEIECESICSTTQNGEILNCYLYGNANENFAICIQAINSRIRCCYYPSGYTKPIGKNDAVNLSDSIMPYGSGKRITEENLPQILNQWILDSGKRLFPHLTFCHWEKGDTLPAVLVSP